MLTIIANAIIIPSLSELVFWTNRFLSGRWYFSFSCIPNRMAILKYVACSVQAHTCGSSCEMAVGGTEIMDRVYLALKLLYGS
jgi:hypothetical protein